MPLSSEAQAYLNAFHASGTPMHTVTPGEARQMVAPIKGPREPVSATRNIWLPGPAGELAARVYTPLSAEDAEELLPTVLFFHGGGWVVGSLDSHDGLCRRLSNVSGAIVLAVDYRLAPEAKYPAAIEDAYAAAVWASKFMEHFGGDPAQLIVCGDSAGGNLAAVVALLARDRGGPAIMGQWLLYPITDSRFDTESYRTNGEGYFLTTEGMKWFWNHYLSDPAQATEPYAAPLRGDLAGLPATVMLTAEYDPLRDEGLAYADRLEQAGVRVGRVACAGQIHSFLRRIDLFPEAVTAAIDAVVQQWAAIRPQ